MQSDTQKLQRKQMREFRPSCDPITLCDWSMDTHLHLSPRTGVCNFRTVAELLPVINHFITSKRLWVLHLHFDFHLMRIKPTHSYPYFSRALSLFETLFQNCMYVCARASYIAFKLCERVCDDIDLGKRILFEYHNGRFASWAIFATVHRTLSEMEVTQVWISFNHTQFSSALYEWMTTMRFKFKWSMICFRLTRSLSSSVCRDACVRTETVSFTVIWFHISLLTFLSILFENLATQNATKNDTVYRHAWQCRIILFVFQSPWSSHHNGDSDTNHTSKSSRRR